MRKPAIKPPMPDIFALQPAYPNPFNPVTNIEFALPVNSNVDIRIYNLAGQSVYQEITVNQQAGWYTLSWEGKDISGQQVPSGVYIISLRALGTEIRAGYTGAMNFARTQKVILMK